MQRRKRSATYCRSANPITDLNTHADTLLIRPISEHPFVSLSRIPDGINIHLDLPLTVSGQFHLGLLFVLHLFLLFQYISIS